MGEPLISVIIPIYNAEKYLNACLDSVCQNDYNCLEIILIDDGSKDASGEICDQYAKKDSRLKVYHQANAGVSRTRNFGISVAKGQYIAFVDSDDTVEKSYFRELLATMGTDDVDLAVGAVGYVRSGGMEVKEGETCIVLLHNPSEEDARQFCKLNRDFLLYGPCNKLYRREIIAKYAVAFPEDTSYGEDLLFNFAYLENCRKIRCRNRPVYYYNQENVGSLSHKYRENLFENGLRLNNAIRQFCCGRGLFSEEMKEYWASRVFDDAYNAVFGVWDKKCTLNLKGKLFRTREIMNHPATREVFNEYPQENYSRFYQTLIRRRYALFFSAIRCIGTICR